MLYDLPKIRITNQDFKSVTALLESLPMNQRNFARGLAEEVDRAEIVSDEKSSYNFVTMYSKVSYKNVDTGEIKTIELTFPEDADLASNRVSILTPIGTALIGLQVGQTIHWPLPSGQVKRIRIKKIFPRKYSEPYRLLKTGS